MLKWNIQNNVISELSSNGVNLINPWGIETADSWSFFSMENGIGYRFEILNKKQTISENLVTSYFHIKMKEGEWTLETEDKIVDNKIIRKAQLTCLKDSIFMDFVVRFRFKKDFFDHGVIADQKIAHEKRNIYHQFAVDKLSLKGPRHEVQLNIIDTQTCNKFVPHLYIRDQVDEWVVHARMIPSAEDKNVIKLCSKYFKTSPLPDAISAIILSSSKIKNYLWYHSEHSPYKTRFAKFFSPNAFPMVKLKSGQKINWHVEVKINGQ